MGRGMSQRQPEEHAGFCHYCGARLLAAERTWDHIIPRAMGGPDGMWNLVTACAPCNNAKADSWSMCLCKYCFEAKMRYWRTRHKKFRMHLDRGHIRDTWFEFLD
jgi:hypothetical protein